MGNFQQHKEWALYNIIILESLLIWFLVQNSFSFSFLQITNVSDQVFLFFVILSIPFIFVVGAISPDIDLPKDSFPTRLFFRYLLPLLFGFGVGLGLYRGIGFIFGMLTTDIYDSTLLLISIASGIFCSLLAFIGVYVLEKKSVHWGFVHSIFFSFFLTGLIYLSLTGIWGFKYIFLVTLQTISYLMGYWNHLICDQIYHEIRNKHWRDKRYALKLWSNNWKYDPLIMLMEFFNPEVRETKRTGHKLKKIASN